MAVINVPSYSHLLPKDKTIRSIQDLYWLLSEVSKSTQNVVGTINDMQNLQDTGAFWGDTVGTV